MSEGATVAVAYVEDVWHKAKGDPGQKPCPKSCPHDPKKPYAAKIHGSGAQWQVRGTDDVGSAIPKENFEDRDDARVRAAELTTDIASGLHQQRRRGEMPFGDFMLKIWWPAAKRRTPLQTHALKERKINQQIIPYLGNIPLADLGPEELTAWDGTLEGMGLGRNERRGTWAVVSTSLQAAKEAKRILVNPCRGFESAKRPKKPKGKARRWMPGRCAAVRAELPERYRMVVDLGAGLGLRAGEVFGFSPADLRGGEAHIVCQVLRVNSQLYFGPCKARDGAAPDEEQIADERRVPVASELELRVKEHIAAFGTVLVTLPWLDPDEPMMAREDRPLVTVELLITTERGTAVNYDYFTRVIWKRALAAVGIIKELPGRNRSNQLRYEASPENGLHILRHIYASIQLQAGESIVSLARWLGHRDPAFTLRTYTHFMPEATGRGAVATDLFLSASPEYELAG